MGVPCLSLEGKIAVVTGSKTGMGRAIALLFAEAGADLALCSRVTTDGKLQSVAEEVRKLGRRSLAMQVDIRDKTAVNNFVQKVSDELGDIGILVNVAGVLNISPLVDLPEEEWDRVLDTDLKGYYLCCQAVGRRMIKQKKGCIINIASTDAFNPIPYQVAYNCAKTGVPMLTSVLAFELGRYNIRVNCIAPGWVKTKMTEYFDTNPAVLKAAEDEVALGRIGEPSEIANVALFLASDLASYVSGATWRVDGAQNPTSLAAAPEQM